MIMKLGNILIRSKDGDDMREEYDFRNAVKNPYAKTAKKQVTMNLNESTVAYFKEMASASGIPYQTLINLYLDDCVKHKRKLEFV